MHQPGTFPSKVLLVSSCERSRPRFCCHAGRMTNTSKFFSRLRRDAAARRCLDALPRCVSSPFRQLMSLGMDPLGPFRAAFCGEKTTTCCGAGAACFHRIVQARQPSWLLIGSGDPSWRRRLAGKQRDFKVARQTVPCRRLWFPSNKGRQDAASVTPAGPPRESSCWTRYPQPSTPSRDFSAWGLGRGYTLRPFNPR